MRTPPSTVSRNFILIVLTFLFSAALLGLGERVSAAPLTVKAGYPQPSGAQLPLWVISEAGTDRKITQEEPEVAKKALARFLATNDSATIDEAYQSFRPLFPKIPYLMEDIIRSVLAVSDHPKAASADPKDFFDNRFLKELEESGFIQELYGSRS